MLIMMIIEEIIIFIYYFIHINIVPKISNVLLFTITDCYLFFIVSILFIIILLWQLTLFKLT